MFADLLLDDAVTRIEGPLLFARREARVGLNSAVEIIGADRATRLGRVAALDESSMVIEVLQPTAGLGLSGTRIRLRPEPLLFGVGPNMLGRVFDSLGRPTSIRRPDSADAPSGVNIAYDGLTQTTSEVVGEGGGQAAA